jgi:hypothetical protein
MYVRYVDFRLPEERDRVARLFYLDIPKTAKKIPNYYIQYQMAIKYTKWP